MQLYVTCIALAGFATIVQSATDIATGSSDWSWTVLAALTLLSGSATVRVPSLPATISVSETFVLTSVLLFGPAAGTLTVALDAFVISLWSYRKDHPLYKIVFNVCALPLTIWLAAQLFFLVAGIEPLSGSKQNVAIRQLLLPLLLFTVAYFGLNSWIITFAIALEKGLAPFKIWRENFLWLSLNYFGGASVAALLVSYTKNLDLTYLAVIVPLLVVLYFTFSMSMGRVEDANKHLSQLNTLYMSTIETLAMAIDAKDQITHGHIRRVQTYAVALAKEMGFTDQKMISAVEAAALLHDMGKLAVPEYILNKPGPLTPTEFEKMKLHASVGADILSAIDFPYPVVPIVRHHHENWDGTGYPDGLAGPAIPLGARILSVVDCFDALTSDRPYRPKWSDKDALRVLMERRGKMYDPLVVDTFMRVHSSIVPPTLEPTTSLAVITGAAASPIANRARTNRLEDITASTGEAVTLFALAQALAAPRHSRELGDVTFEHLRRLIPHACGVLFAYRVDSDDLCAVAVSGRLARQRRGDLEPLRRRRQHPISGRRADRRQIARQRRRLLRAALQVEDHIWRLGRQIGRRNLGRPAGQPQAHLLRHGARPRRRVGQQHAQLVGGQRHDLLIFGVKDRQPIRLLGALAQQVEEHAAGRAPAAAIAQPQPAAAPRSPAPPGAAPAPPSAPEPLDRRAGSSRAALPRSRPAARRSHPPAEAPPDRGGRGRLIRRSRPLAPVSPRLAGACAPFALLALALA